MNQDRLVFDKDGLTAEDISNIDLQTELGNMSEEDLMSLRAEADEIVTMLYKRDAKDRLRQQVRQDKKKKSRAKTKAQKKSRKVNRK